MHSRPSIYPTSKFWNSAPAATVRLQHFTSNLSEFGVVCKVCGIVHVFTCTHIFTCAQASTIACAIAYTRMRIVLVKRLIATTRTNAHSPKAPHTPCLPRYTPSTRPTHTVCACTQCSQTQAHTNNDEFTTYTTCSEAHRTSHCR
jgi:hypothetical protein